MRIRQETDYAIRCVLYLSRNQGKICTVNEIATAMLMPKVYVAKIMQKIARAGIASSVRGVKGGYVLNRSPEGITLLEVIVIMEGTPALNVCFVEGKECSLVNQCTVHPVFAEVRNILIEKLSEVNFKMLASRSENLRPEKKGG